MVTSIIGLGWLGLPVALKLKKQGYSVKGSTTSKEKLSHLKQDIENCYLLNLPNETGTLSELFDTTMLVINIPPKINSEDHLFEEKIKIIVDKVSEIESIQKVIFISSTSVYGAGQGVVNESHTTLPTTSSGTKLKWAEDQFKCLREDKIIHIVRPSGLIGPNRNPLNFFKNRKIPSPNSPVNFIHLDDLKEIIFELLTEDYQSNTWNVSYPLDLDKKSFYEELARRAGTKVEFEDSIGPNKKIESINLEKLKWKLKNSPLERIEIV